MYKSYIETKHENRDRLGPSEMGYAGYLLTRPRNSNIALLTFTTLSEYLADDKVKFFLNSEI